MSSQFGVKLEFGWFLIGDDGNKTWPPAGAVWTMAPPAYLRHCDWTQDTTGTRNGMAGWATYYGSKNGVRRIRVGFYKNARPGAYEWEYERFRQAVMKAVEMKNLVSPKTREFLEHW